MTKPLNAANIAKLTARFARIPDRMKAAARQEIEAEADAMVAEMKRGVAVDEGDLRDSIKARDTSSETWIRTRVSAGDRTTQREVRGGSQVFVNTALLVELGHKAADGTWVEAEPYFFPVYRRRARRFRNRLRRVLLKAAKAG